MSCQWDEDELDVPGGVSRRHTSHKHSQLHAKAAVVCCRITPEPVGTVIPVVISTGDSRYPSLGTAVCLCRFGAIIGAFIAMFAIVRCLPFAIIFAICRCPGRRQHLSASLRSRTAD